MDKLTEQEINADYRTALEEMTWLVDSYYDLHFHEDSDISERVIFPISPLESQGIEDARFVNFEDDDGNKKVYATYTAYDGHTILPKLLSTEDFQNFRIMPMHGKAAQNKNFALFPKKINGKYAVLARVDGVNNYLIYSDRITLWNNPIKIQEPKYPWEFTQIGNCGSPIATDKGWLVLTHGVAPCGGIASVPRYSIWKNPQKKSVDWHNHYCLLRKKNVRAMCRMWSIHVVPLFIAGI